MLKLFRLKHTWEYLIFSKQFYKNKYINSIIIFILLHMIVPQFNKIHIVFPHRPHFTHLSMPWAFLLQNYLRLSSISNTSFFFFFYKMMKIRLDNKSLSFNILLPGVHIHELAFFLLLNTYTDMTLDVPTDHGVNY